MCPIDLLFCLNIDFFKTKIKKLFRKYLKNLAAYRSETEVIISSTDEFLTFNLSREDLLNGRAQYG